MQEINNWGVPYSVITFFERALRGHDMVISFDRTNDIYFTIKDIHGRTLQVLLINDYSIGIAAILRARSEFPDLEYIVTGGNWNGYTAEAKEYGQNNSIGIFNIGEFLGSLNWTDPKRYFKKDDDGNPLYSFKNS